MRARRSKPLVSVIIIFFNSERFLQEAIESVLAQRYDAWELLLVDDGSTDASTQTAREYAVKTPEKVRYLEHAAHANRGMSAARNLGYRHARGEYVAFLDSDDVWLPHKLERQVDILEAWPKAGMVYGRTLYWHSWTGDFANGAQDYMPDLGVDCDRVLPSPLLLTLSLESKAPTPCPSDILLRRAVVQAVGGFNEDFHGPLQLYEDQVFLAKVYLRTPVFVSSECWDKYRQHGDSCVAVVTAAGRKHEIGLAYLEWLENYLIGQGVAHEELWRALRIKRRRYRYPRLSPILERMLLRLTGMGKLLAWPNRRGPANGASGRKIPADPNGG